MVNTDDFIKRLEIVLDYYTLTASLFADKVGVQRSGLSHLMSGRNKPSLDFVMKIAENFPEVDLYWLLKGTGTFPKKSEKEITQDEPAQPSSPPAPQYKETVMGDLFSQHEPISEPDQSNTNTEFKISAGGKQAQKIVVFYSDNTFKEYFPSE
jgi:transcriptional regulator with XRE-family HTH domain